LGSDADGEAVPDVDDFFLGEKKEGIGREEAQGDITAVPRESEPRPPVKFRYCGTTLLLRVPCKPTLEVWWASADAKTSTFLVEFSGTILLDWQR
jgi:hypothetical protein